MNLLMDASTIVELVREGKVRYLMDAKTTPIAKYECMNAFWKESRIFKRFPAEKALELLAVLVEAFSVLEVVEPDDGRVMEIALKESIPVYDALYITAALEADAALVTEDQKLRSVAEKYVKVMQRSDLGKTSVLRD